VGVELSALELAFPTFTNFYTLRKTSWNDRKLLN
jgi:hypothetical protein